MRLQNCFLLLAAALAAPVLRADVTLRYKTTITGQMPMPGPTGDGEEIHMKGQKGVTSSDGMTTLVDFARQEITLVDIAGKRFATIPASEYKVRLASTMPPVDKNMFGGELPGATAESRKTGKTDSIQGVRVEESETTMSFTVPAPKGGPAPAPTIRMVIDAWNAAPGETLRVSAIHQLSGFNLWQDYFMRSTDAMSGILPKAVVAVLNSKAESVVMRTTTKMYMDFPGVPTSSALMEIGMEVVELSTAPVDDSFFAISPDYKAAAFEDILKGSMETRLQAIKGETAKANIPAGEVKAYVPRLTPVHQSQPALPEEAQATGVTGFVELLLTIGPDGHVVKAEALAGHAALRLPAEAAVKDWTFRPVLRNGSPVMAYTDTIVNFFDRNGLAAGQGINPDRMNSAQRKIKLQQEMPRTVQEILGDFEQDAVGREGEVRFYALNQLTSAALNAGAIDKAESYAKEWLAMAPAFPKDWNFGNAIHDGHMTLGLVALEKNNISGAREQLLEAGKSTGSPQLNSFGPNMKLAKALLEKGQTEPVLEYFALCRTFWKSGSERLDEWSATVRKGGIPAFVMSLR